MRVSVLGCGVVGGGVWDGLEAAGFQRGPALVRPGKERRGQTAAFGDILDDPRVDAVVETLGGLSPARDYCTAALRAGKSVVTANKALVAAWGPELAAMAREHGAGFLFSAACGGGVPFLPNLAAAAAGPVESVGGVLNGTTNYILDAMQREGQSFAGALARAQALGFAEADPSADLSGLDTARKLALACAVGFSLLPGEEEIAREGILSFTSADARALARRGLVCRLLARAGRRDGGYFACVQPALFPADAPESALRGCDNLARYVGPGGPVSLTGGGAGRGPTAAAVLRDLQAIRQGRPVMLPADCRWATPDNDLLALPYLFRVPEELASLVPGTAEKGEGCAWVETPPMLVSAAHGLARALRARGPVFFAAREGKQ